MIQKAIREYQATGGTPGGSTAGLGGPAAIDPLLARLKDLERNLATLSAEYKDTYPDIIQTKQEILTIKAQLLEKDQQSNKDIDQEGLKSFDSYLAGLVRQRDEAKSELIALKKRYERLLGLKADHEGRVARMPERRRLVYTLSRDRHLSYAEIADVLGIAPKTVEIQIGRALRDLRDGLAAEWSVP